MRILKSNRRIIPLFSLLALLTLNPQPSTAYAQGTAFTYQGRLNDGGSPAHGTYDLRFAIYDAASAGSQQGNLLTNSATAVSNGLFTVTLDFGNQFPGAARWLEIGVRTNGAGSFFTLSPRQSLTPAPYAVTAGNVVSGGLAAGSYGNPVSLNNPANQFTGMFTGNGANVTNVNAATLGGLAVVNFWQLGGNSTTGQFLGTVNNQPLDLYAGGVRAMRLNVQADAGGTYSNAPNVVGGSPVNLVKAGTVGGTVGGGGGNGTNGLAYPNQVNADFGTISGGSSNTVSGVYAFISGGFQNRASGDYSTVAGGYDNVASGYASTAMGFESIASGYASTAMGFFPLAGGPYSTAMGSSIATGTNSAALGYSSATNSYATAMGNSSAGGQYSTAVGHSSAHDDYSTAMGQSTASGYSATAMGGGTATGQYSTALGYAFAYGDYSSALGGSEFIAAEADGASSFASGPGAKAAHDYCFVWNDSYGPLPYTSTGRDQFLIHAHGGVGIDTTAPQSALHIADTSGITIGQNFSSGGYTALQINLSAINNGYAVLQAIQSSGSSYGNLILNQYGANVGIATGANTPGHLLVVGGSGSPAYCDGTTWVNGSDRNSKENFTALDAKKVLAKVVALPLTEWNYKTDPAGRRHIGPMAQDFHAAFSLNGEDDKHIATVDEEGVALAAIQGLNQRLNEKDDEIRQLKESVAQLHELVSQLAKSQSK